MSVTELVFFTLLLLGLSALLAGVLLTRLHWRADIPPYGLGTRSLDVTLHPEKYVSDAPIGVIRILNLVGALLLASAGVVVTFEILRVIWRE